MDAAIIIQRSWRSYRVRRLFMSSVRYVVLVLREEYFLDEVPDEYRHFVSLLVAHVRRSHPHPLELEPGDGEYICDRCDGDIHGARWHCKDGCDYDVCDACHQLG